MSADWFDFPVRIFLKVILCAWWQSHRSTNKESVKAIKSQCLPPEIWEKIFQRLPVKSLVKCTCICKVWKSIISDQAFVLSHFSHRTTRANNNGSDSLFLHYQFLTNPKYRSIFVGLLCQPFSFQPKIKSEQYLLVRSDDKEASCLAIITTSLNHPHMSDLDAVGTCGGLVCFVKYSESLEFEGFIIMNLSIRKYMALPKPDDVSLTAPYPHPYWYCRLFGFGFDSRNKDFKVVMLFISFFSSKKQHRSTQVEVYSLATGKWRSINHGTPSICYCSYLKPKHNVMFVNGALHWIFCGNCKTQHRSIISTFDLADETFGETKLPNFWDESCFGASLLVRGNYLALAYQKYSDGHEIKYIVCVMKEYGVVDSWDVVFSVGSTQYPGIDRVMALTSSEKVAVQTYDERIIILDEDMNKETVEDLGLQKYNVGFAADHVESLFLINQENNAYVNSNKGILDIRFVSPK